MYTWEVFAWEWARPLQPQAAWEVQATFTRREVLHLTEGTVIAWLFSVPVADALRALKGLYDSEGVICFYPV
jgi:hypothetical protein